MSEIKKLQAASDAEHWLVLRVEERKDMGGPQRPLWLHPTLRDAVIDRERLRGLNPGMTYNVYRSGRIFCWPGPREPLAQSRVVPCDQPAASAPHSLVIRATLRSALPALHPDDGLPPRWWDEAAADAAAEAQSRGCPRRLFIAYHKVSAAEVAAARLGPAA
jgi:hypothetical protein